MTTCCMKKIKGQHRNEAKQYHRHKIYIIELIYNIGKVAHLHIQINEHIYTNIFDCINLFPNGVKDNHILMQYWYRRYFKKYMRKMKNHSYTISCIIKAYIVICLLLIFYIVLYFNEMSLHCLSELKLFVLKGLESSGTFLGKICFSWTYKFM